MAESDRDARLRAYLDQPGSRAKTAIVQGLLSGALQDPSVRQRLLSRLTDKQRQDPYLALALMAERVADCAIYVLSTRRAAVADQPPDDGIDDAGF